MKATIVHFRGSQKHKKGNQMILMPKEANNSSALVGKQVIWKSPAGKEIKGKVTALHGRNGALRALFEKGLPGQSISTEVEIK